MNKDQDNLDGKLEDAKFKLDEKFKKFEEERLRSISIQTTKVDSWDDDKYFKKHLSNIETEITLPELVKDVNFKIHIADAGKLIISPGTELNFLNKNHIHCFGQLISNGEDSKEIILAGTSKVLYFTFSNFESSIKYCIVKGSGNSKNLAVELKDDCGIEVQSSAVKIEKCQIYNHLGKNSGGILLSKSHINISHNFIHDNGSQYAGGGLFIRDCKGEVRNNDIYKNVARTGGGIFIADSIINFSNNNVYSNIAKKMCPSEYFDRFYNDDFYQGGGINISNSKVFGDNNIIEYNEAVRGGGISIGKETSVFLDPSETTSVFTGQMNIVRYNAARTSGGISKSLSPGRSNINHNCIVKDNYPE